MTEAIEICPFCEGENVYPGWDVKKDGYVAKCQHCGEDILLCDECTHAEDNPYGRCDWSEPRCCFRIPKPTLRFNSSGESGNIFFILGMVAAALHKQRRITDYNNLRDKVIESGSYAEALKEIRRIVDLIDDDGNY